MLTIIINFTLSVEFANQVSKWRHTVLMLALSFPLQSSCVSEDEHLALCARFAGDPSPLSRMVWHTSSPDTLCSHSGACTMPPLLTDTYISFLILPLPPPLVFSPPPSFLSISSLPSHSFSWVVPSSLPLQPATSQEHSILVVSSSTNGLSTGAVYQSGSSSTEDSTWPSCQLTSLRFLGL